MSFQHSRRPSKSWSGRGTSVLDAIERMSEEPYSAKVTKRAPQRHKTPVEEKLKQLEKKYPKNRFYKSLQYQIKKYALSKKQVELIELDYWKYFKQY